MGFLDQTELSWKQELKEAIKFSGEHMSAYQLTIEKGTPFYSMHRDKSFILPSETTLLNLYQMDRYLLKDAKL